jgi:hypothetical protein
LEEKLPTQSIIYCAACDRNVKSSLVSGWEVFPNQTHLRNCFFWKCPDCGNFVGTHKIKNNDFAPLGPIASKKMRERQKIIRNKINSILELKKDIPDAKEKLYKWLSKKLYLPDYRTEWILSKDRYQQVLKFLDLIKT